MAFVREHYFASHWHWRSSKVSSLGRITLRIKLPGTAGGIPEPLVVCGAPGNASLVYIRLLKGAQAKVGVEFWGMDAFEGDKFALPAADATIVLSCELPVLFPPEGSPRWKQTSAGRQRILRHEYLVEVDGVARLKGDVTYEQPNDPPIYFGVNPVGGSLVSDRFTGHILNPPEAQ